jgi:RNA polymerase sigma-70 factor (ECF subfamily)
MEPTDIELMLRVRGGDLRAFQQLVERYREPLRRFFAALLADRSQADDCVQETFLRLWLLRDRYEPTGRFSTYLFQIGKHHLLNERRKASAMPVRPIEAGDQELWIAVEGQPEPLLLRQVQSARIRSAVEALPEIYRSVFQLSHFEGLKYAEIACRLQIPVGTVKSRMAEAMRRMRESLSEDTSL